ncbi:response regulator transcription factor [Mycobacterium sp. AT1]|uniref:response regulator transcription factor n=1 Tax=Mycobacterium sp. AT1 TaxID=1961706 RepID=UPI0009AEFE88|nr:response regulator transcription factor [Mycobacterium sp. AT1]OPX08725.1 DNA-binding response regulator [Mycobacterium sp. AT1]
MVRASGEPIHALIVDVDPLATELVSFALRREGWHVSVATDGPGALHMGRSDPPDLVVIEVDLPGLDGLEVMRGLRASRPTIPVMLLSTLTAPESRIEGLAQGCDDYVTKPFHIEEVVLRLRSLIKRSGLGVESGIIEVGDLILNEFSHEATRGGKPVSLTATEYRLLRLLMLNANRIVSKPKLLEEVWGYDFGGNTNIVELFISYLRKKVDSGHQPMIRTVRGCGYMLKAVSRPTG